MPEYTVEITDSNEVFAVDDTGGRVAQLTDDDAAGLEKGDTIELELENATDTDPEPDSSDGNGGADDIQKLSADGKTVPLQALREERSRNRSLRDELNQLKAQVEAMSDTQKLDTGEMFGTKSEMTSGQPLNLGNPFETVEDDSYISGAEAKEGFNRLAMNFQRVMIANRVDTSMAIAATRPRPENAPPYKEAARWAGAYLNSDAGLKDAARILQAADPGEAAYELGVELMVKAGKIPAAQASSTNSTPTADGERARRTEEQARKVKVISPARSATNSGPRAGGKTNLDNLPLGNWLTTWSKLTPEEQREYLTKRDNELGITL